MTHYLPSAVVVAAFAHLVWRPEWTSVAALVACAVLAMWLESQRRRDNDLETLELHFKAVADDLSKRMDALAQRCDGLPALSERVDSLARKHDEVAAVVHQPRKKAVL